jgi:acetyl-CoA carboxylase carboxyl transferase subunit alpha
MLEHAVYSVISPEGCSSILWKSSAKAQDAAAAMKITAQDLFQLRVIDQVVAEPIGGAHRNRDRAMEDTGDAVDLALTELDQMPADLLRKTRWDKYLAIGRVGLA